MHLAHVITLTSWLKVSQVRSHSIHMPSMMSHVVLVLSLFSLFLTCFFSLTLSTCSLTCTSTSTMSSPPRVKTTALTHNEEYCTVAIYNPLTEIGDFETRESVMKKSRVGADMEISAIEALPNAELEVDLALTRQTTRRCIACWKKFNLSLGQSPKPQNSTTSETSESTLRCTRTKPTPRLPPASGCWNHTMYDMCWEASRKTWRTKDVFASTTMTASVRMLLSQATDLRSEGYTVFKADVITTFLNAHMKDGDVVYAKPPPEWQPETLDLSKGTVSDP